jgi:hypothetical protein
MLAYELYLNNKDSKSEAVKRLKLVKKLFVNENGVEIDTKTLDEYGTDIIDISQSYALNFLQQWLSMPLNTADQDKLNLPDKKTGTRSLPPYVKIYGKFIINKKEKYISLEIDGRDPENIKSKEKKSFRSRLDLSTHEETLSTSAINNKIVLNIEKSKYQIGNANLFQAYVDANVITCQGIFENSLFNKISSSFFEFVRGRPLPQEEYPHYSNSPFEIFVLPGDSPVKFNSPSREPSSTDNNYFIDSFGNTCSLYDSKTTQNAKFLSFDDVAFTLNCKEGAEFYKDLGIGLESLDKINIPVKNVFKIAGLNWVFINISDPYFSFKDVRRGGFYAQLYNNYHSLLKESNEIYREQVQMKIICYKQMMLTKVEILIDENLTMDRLRRIIIVRSNDDPGYSFAFEDVLIDRGKTSKQSNVRNPILSDYLNAVRNLITDTYFEKNRLVEICSRKIKSKIFEWLDFSNKELKNKKINEAKKFFIQSEFCFKTLLASENNPKKMDSHEEYACNIGKIAGRYVRFRIDTEENNNSLRDILTYSKYDRDKLRTVFKRIGLGLNASKAKQAEQDKVSLFIKNNLPEGEITDDKQDNDYSYFFYKGVFQQLAGDSD